MIVVISLFAKERMKNLPVAQLLNPFYKIYSCKQQKKAEPLNIKAKSVGKFRNGHLNLFKKSWVVIVFVFYLNFFYNENDLFSAVKVRARFSEAVLALLIFVLTYRGLIVRPTWYLQKIPT